MTTGNISCTSLTVSGAVTTGTVFRPGFATTATAAGTTTLTAASAQIQEFTGATTQTIVLPDVTTLTAGHPYNIINSSTGALTINSSGGNLVQTLNAGERATITCILASGTSAASWTVRLFLATTATGAVSNPLTIDGLVTVSYANPILSIDANDGINDRSAMLKLIGGAGGAAGTRGAIRFAATGATQTYSRLDIENNAGTVLMSCSDLGVVTISRAGGSSLSAVGTYNETTASAANVYCGSGGAFLRSTSSIRYKTKVEPMEYSLAEAVLNLEPVWYRSTARADNPAWSFYGLIAEDVAKVDPRFVHWSPEILGYTEAVKATKIDESDGKPYVVEVEPSKPIHGDLIPDGVQYERLVVPLLMLVKNLTDRVLTLESKFKP